MQNYTNMFNLDTTQSVNLPLWFAQSKTLSSEVQAGAVTVGVIAIS